MRLTLKVCLSLTLLLLPTLSSFAQKVAGDQAKLLRDADRAFSQFDFPTADKLYRMAIKKDAGNWRIMQRIAEVNQEMMKYEESSKWYQAALDVEPTANDTLWFNLGRVLKTMENFVESTRAFDRFIELHRRNDFLTRQARMEIEGNKFAQVELRRKPGYQVTKAGVSSNNTDYDPAVFVEGNNRFLVFSSARRGSLGKEVYGRFGAEPYSDLWVAKMNSDSTFGGPTNMGKMINTQANDGSATFTPDGLMMYYAIANKGKIAKEGGDNFGVSIYQSKFDKDKKVWSRYELAPRLNSTQQVTVDSRGKTKTVPGYDAHPFITADGQTLYFVSDRPGGRGGQDIWYCTRVGNEWSEPQNAGPEVNTEFNDIQPFVSADGRTLYFASEGHIGLGGYDLYKVEGTPGSWGRVENLGYPLNTTYDETSIMWLQPEQTGLITSNRPGGSGKSDIYYYRVLPRTPDEGIEITIQGRVRDVKTKQAIPFATVQLYETDGTALTPIDTFKTDQTSQYKFILKRDRDYKLVGNAPEYLANEVFVSTKNITSSTQLEADIDILLERIEISRPIVLQNIYYDFDKAELRPESITELERIVALMRENPGITIQIGSHTDTNGSEKYNLNLSERRARSVVNYLVEKGIAKNRIKSFGFGESQPLVYPEMSDADEQTNRRSEFRILTLDLPPGR